VTDSVLTNVLSQALSNISFSVKLEHGSILCTNSTKVELKNAESPAGTELCFSKGELDSCYQVKRTCLSTSCQAKVAQDQVYANKQKALGDFLKT
jgi:hypothetical protein